ncbi:6-bladed beta-propeller [Herbaspirillum sp. ST 5-3]|uniref:6-bladed beta-propeller n=1 Tax=Oxalobacteraceae TaxID=75682 RepID=UPI0010A38EE9|nr:6-bladed beta-propeller [Herbaspirillum sp. ST 5-3]
MIRRIFTLSLLGLVLLLSGCGETRYVMRLDPEPAKEHASLVWPAAPEIPRFRYVGQLTGEQNFVPEDGEKQAIGSRILRWLVGLTGNGEDRTVLKRPQSGMTGSDGRVYVSDIAAHAVFVFDRMAGKLSVWTQSEEYRNFVTPIGVAEGPGGQVLVADAELGRVYRLDRDGKPIDSFGKDILVRPTGLARDAQRHRIYVADTHAHDIKVFDDDGMLVDTIGHRGEDQGELNFPTHLAIAGDKLYVTDSMNARLQIFNLQGRVIRSIGRRGLYIGNMTRPKGVTVDPSGNIYVVESFYDNLLVFNSEGKFLMPIGGTGKDIGQFYLPSGVWSDQQGRIHVADMFNGRIVIFQFIGAM